MLWLAFINWWRSRVLPKNPLWQTLKNWIFFLSQIHFLFQKVLADRESVALSTDTIAYSKGNFSIDNKLEIKSKVMVINPRRDKII